MMWVMVVWGGACDTMIVGVDCTTWTRLELLVSEEELISIVLYKIM